MSDDITRVIFRNGLFAKRSIRELGDMFALFGTPVERPTDFTKGVAVISLLDARHKGILSPWVLLFLECEPDAVWMWQPPIDSEVLIKESLEGL